VLPVPQRPDDEPTSPAAEYTEQYAVVEASSAEALQENVNAFLRDGWRLQGGVAVATNGALSWWYYQALVRP